MMAVRGVSAHCLAEKGQPCGPRQAISIMVRAISGRGFAEAGTRQHAWLDQHPGGCQDGGI
jgi:hypothetical protein